MQQAYPDYYQKIYDDPHDLRVAAFGMYPWVLDNGKVYMGEPHEHHPEMMHRLFPERFQTDIMWNDTVRRKDDTIYGTMEQNGNVHVYFYNWEDVPFTEDEVKQ